MNSAKIMNKSILAVAVLVMAAFAGVMVVGEDTDAAAATSITYDLGGGELTTKAVATGVTTFIAPTPADLGFNVGEKEFKYWKAGSTIYRAGVEYAIPEEGASTLTAKFDTNVYVTLIINDEKFKCIVGKDEKIDVTSDAYKAADAALKAIDDSKFRLRGFFAADAKEATDIATATFSESITLIEKIVPFFKISFIVENTTIVALDSDKINLDGVEMNIPGAPSKANHTFAGWFDTEGKQIIKYAADAEIKYTYTETDYVFTADTSLYAKFVPANMTVTFQIGDKTTPQIVLYGEKIGFKPELPAGYIAWVDADGKEFNFDTPITSNITLIALAGEPATIYNVTFMIEGKTPVTQKSDSLVLPDTAREGQIFQGWVVEGTSQFVDPMTYEITGDITFKAMYKDAPAPEPEKEKFYQTTTGQVILVIIGFAIIALIACYAMNYGGFRDKIPSFRIERVKKE